MLFHDFEYELRTNPGYRDKVQKAVVDLDKAYKYTLAHNTGYKEHQEALLEYLRISRFNVTPLLGFYFPRYPGNSPYSLKDFSFAHCYFTLNIGPGSFTVFRGSRQIGKSVFGDTMLRVRNKKTGEISEIPIGELFELHKAKCKTIAEI